MMDMLQSHIILIYLTIILTFYTLQSRGLDLTQCNKVWVQASKGSYAYRVDCSNLGFKEIPRNLPLLTSELLLNGNSISTVDDQAFAGLNSLHTLDLSGNDIVSIGESAFEKNTAIKKLDLSSNKLFCDWRIWWLVSFSKRLDKFEGECFTPRSLRGTSITNLTKTDLSVDCLSVKKLTGAIVDGEYPVRVFGRDNSEHEISIYCYNMNSKTPKEYVTLPSGPVRNYVFITKKKTCSYGSDIALASYPDDNITSHFLRFHIDLARLTIISTDATFGTNPFLQYGQPAVCGKSVCIPGSSSIDLRGTHFQLKESKQVIMVASCSEKCGLCPTSENIELDLIDKKKQPYSACTLPLGMQNNIIPDTSITASSFSGKHFQPYYARLNSLSYSGWCAAEMDGSQYLLIDLQKTMTVSGISTQGHKDNADWVKAYKLMYSMDGVKYHRYHELGNKKSLTANKDSNTVVTHWLKPRIMARYIKIHPQLWNDDGLMEHKICMRVELYGCESDLTSYIIKPALEGSCLTADFKSSGKPLNLIKKPLCSGPDFMFIYHHRKLRHAKTGLCLNVNEDSAFVLDDCTNLKLMFMKVSHPTGDAFLIKDLNGNCARLFANEQTGYLYSIWRYCQRGGFTILELSRNGISAFPPNFDENKITVRTDLFREVTITCKANADPYPVYNWIKVSAGGATVKHGITTKNDHSVLRFKNVTWIDRGLYACNAWNADGSATKNVEIVVNPLQRFDVVPVSQRVIYGRTAVFQCVSKGIPTPVIQWLVYDELALQYKNVSELDKKKFIVMENGSLEIKSVEYNDQAMYKCLSISPGLQRNVSASLKVYVTQSFTKVPESAIALYGNDVMFECKSKGEPIPRIEWQVKWNRLNDTIVIDESYGHKYVILNNGSLLIKNSKIEDEGDYICVSYSPGLVKSVKASLTVYVTQTFTTAPTDIKVLYSYDAKFECVSVGQPSPVVYWTKRDPYNQFVKIENTSKIEVDALNTLHVRNVKYEDEGSYACVSKSPRLKRNVTVKLDVYVTQEFALEPSDAEVLYGANYTLECLSVGIPEPRVSWKFQRTSQHKAHPIKKYNPRKYQVLQDGKSLQIFNSTLGESGTYYCVSHSPGLVVNSSAAIDVLVNQRFSKKPSSLTLLRGEEAFFECASEGVPTPRVTWSFRSLQRVLKTQEDMLLDSRLEISSTGLKIRNVQNKDEGSYFCVSESPGLTRNSSATLTVHIQPQISLSKSEGIVLVGQPIEVICTSAGDPSPNVQWYKLKKGSNVIEKKMKKNLNHKLVFTRPVKADAGKYICEAKNAAGTTRAEFNLTVQATCALSVITNSVKMDKYIYLEGKKVKVDCMKGFELKGFEKNDSVVLTCQTTGMWDKAMPTCQDINECGTGRNETDGGSGQSFDFMDDEPEVCDIYAQCINTIGSYQCVCDEGYRMIKNKCEYSPPGSEPPQPATQQPATTPSPKDYIWLQILMQEFQNQRVDEKKYLSQIQELSENMTSFSYEDWKVEALEKLLLSLTLTVSNDKLIFPFDNQRQNAVKNMQMYGSIINNALERSMQEYWETINKKNNGSVLLMKYLENFAVNKAKSLKKSDFKTDRMLFSYKNLEIQFYPVTNTLNSQPMQIPTTNQGNEVEIPSENYKQFEGSIGVAISYKNLHKILPKPYLKDVKNSVIETEIFSVSFTSDVSSNLSKPIKIKFKVQKDVPKQRVCSFWDFEKPNGGEWSTEGCKASNLSTSSEVICECSHLTNFAVISSRKTITKVIYLTFHLSVAIGAGLCVLLAFITCMAHICCSPYVRSDRSTILCNVTVVIILAIILFTGGVVLANMTLVPESLSSVFCCAMWGILQLFGVAFFAWTFAEAIHLFLSTRTVIDKGNGHLCLIYFLGWGIPILLLAVTGVLVYLNKFNLQDRCVLLNVSYYFLGIIIGVPSALFVIATIFVYIIISISVAKSKDILSLSVISHARRAVFCSSGFIVIELIVLGAAVLFLRFNSDWVYHYAFGGALALQGLYLLLYHCVLDRTAGRMNSRQNSKKRNSYSTKETVTYSPSSTNETGADTNDQKYLIKRSSKRYSGDPSRPSPPQLRTQGSSDDLETSVGYVGMYGGSPGSASSPETKPLLRQQTEDLPDTIYEEEDGLFDDQASLPTFGHVSRTNSNPSSRHNSLPRKKPLIWDEASIDGSQKHLKRSNSKASSIVSIETHISSTNQPGLPVYFPAAPPQYEMSLQQNSQSQLNNIDDYLDEVNISRPSSFGIDSDRLSNVSSELSNILFELQAFDTERHPSVNHTENGSKTLPSSRNETGMTDLSRNSSTFKPKSQRAYAKTEVTHNESKPTYTDNNRVRILRGRSHAETDPSDGLHHENSDSMYSSL